MHSSAKYMHRVMTGNEIRKQFIDYFISNEHKFVRSSPVVPFCDPSLAFVNAGMNQFKSVLLGKSPAPAPRVTNSQKCVRVGGKHNDLSVVGTDGYHHTFFEMLGSWSFKNYFKEDACRMALELLRDIYGIDQRRLYVTYFSGDEKLNLEADLECMDIWQRLGIDKEHILPFDRRDNFWEMGSTGPCGPCTEIHMDHHPVPRDAVKAAKLVNAGHADLTELWNIVFMQYNRTNDGVITKLPYQHVDTGMGLERLTAALQQKSSNYDTDLFMPIFDVIRDACKTPSYRGVFAAANDTHQHLDTNYRIVADHMRMITICLADGMLPNVNQKLQRVMRKVFTLSDTAFQNPLLPYAVLPIIVDTLGEAYPELVAKQKVIKEIIAHEHEVFKALRSKSAKVLSTAVKECPELAKLDLTDCPGFVSAYNDFQAQKHNFQQNNTISGEFLYKIHHTYGVPRARFEQLAELSGMQLDMNGFDREVMLAKLKSRQSVLQPDAELEAILAEWTSSLPPTETRYRYSFMWNCLQRDTEVPVFPAEVRAIYYKGQQTSKSDEKINIPCEPMWNAKLDNEPKGPFMYIVTDMSHFYTESGGQEGDRGIFELPVHDSKLNDYWRVFFSIREARLINKCVVHMCDVPGVIQYMHGKPTPHSQDTWENDGKSQTAMEQKIANDQETIENELKTVPIQIGDIGRLRIDQPHRTANNCHHTAVHLLNAVLHYMFNKAVFQVSSAVNSAGAKLEVAIYGGKLDYADIKQLEAMLKKTVCAAMPVVVLQKTALEVYADENVITVPGEVYPENELRVVEITSPSLKFTSKELCCGTHATNTGLLKEICLINVKQTGRACYAFNVVAHKKAQEALSNKYEFQKKIAALEKSMDNANTDRAELEKTMQQIHHDLTHANLLLPFSYKVDTKQHLEQLLRQLKNNQRSEINEFVDVEMRTVLQDKANENKRFILHYLDSSALMEEVPLQKATRLCKDRPILVVGVCEGVITARCCVPKQFQTEHFNAEKWLRTFSDTFNSGITAPKGQIVQNVCTMRPRKLSVMPDEQIEEAMARAQDFAKQLA